MNESHRSTFWDRTVLLWLGVVLVGIALVARYLAHPTYLHDPESLMVPTVGREFAHGHFAHLAVYQYNLYQGGVLIDGTLSAVGFWLWGDSLWAWRGYTIGYGLVIALCGAVLLRRIGNARGALLFLLLLAVAPFLLKDGLITPAGHHSSALAWALAALAIAAGGGGKPDFRRGVLCGLLLGIGIFYTRTTVAAVPAAALLLVPGGWRALVGAFVGGCSLLLLGGIEALLALRGVPNFSDFSYLEVLRQVFFHIRG